MIPVYKPYLTEKERNNLISAFDSSWISSRGSFLESFGKSLANFTNLEHVNLVSNGTVALHLALIALDIGPGDEVLLPDFSYVASANAVKYVGATPVFVDANNSSWQMNLEDLELKINSRSKAIIAVHTYGNSEDMNSIVKIKEKYNLLLIEDCAEAIGTFQNHSHVGKYGDISTLSFFGNKTITTGEGGAVLTRSSKYHENIAKLKNQGLSEYMTYFHDVIGYNYRMTNLAASIGLAQLERIDEILDLKGAIAKYYKANINTNLTFQQDTLGTKNSNWMVSVRCNSLRERNALRKFLFDNDIETRPGFTAISSLPMYIKEKINPIANDLSETVINLPSYPTLSPEELSFIVGNINRYYETY